ncbi:MAG: hypothetical protein PHQ28_15305 [Mycobacterium sp.]|nr:hypothetical protein [Mycobacterium sp.]
MKTRRETPKRRGGNDRRDGRNGAARKAESASSRHIRPAKPSAVSREGRVPKSGPQTGPITRPADRPARPKSTSQAKARARARKAKSPKVVRPHLTERLAARLASVDLRPRTLAGKVPFVVLVIGALGIGLGLTLWLSTASAERSYQLSHARERNRLLQQQKESLERDVREAESAPALAEAARRQGMIPTRDTAHLVQDLSGNWVVVGNPKPADGVPPPPLNTKLPDAGAQPPPHPAAAPLEVPVRVEPVPGAPAPGSAGPEALLRAPDGAATLGGQHLPQTAPQPPDVPGAPVTGQFPGASPTPGLPTPGGAPPFAQPPAEVPIPFSPAAPAPYPADGAQLGPAGLVPPGAPQ